MKVDICKGLNIYSAAEKVCELAKVEDKSVTFEFNGIEVGVNPKSYPTDIVRIYCLLHENRRLR